MTMSMVDICKAGFSEDRLYDSMSFTMSIDSGIRYHMQQGGSIASLFTDGVSFQVPQWCVTKGTLEHSYDLDASVTEYLRYEYQRNGVDIQFSPAVKIADDDGVRFVATAYIRPIK